MSLFQDKKQDSNMVESRKGIMLAYNLGDIAIDSSKW